MNVHMKLACVKPTHEHGVYSNFDARTLGLGTASLVLLQHIEGYSQIASILQFWLKEMGFDTNVTYSTTNMFVIKDAHRCLLMSCHPDNGTYFMVIHGIGRYALGSLYDRTKIYKSNDAYSSTVHQFTPGMQVQDHNGNWKEFDPFNPPFSKGSSIPAEQVPTVHQFTPGMQVQDHNGIWKEFDPFNPPFSKGSSIPAEQVLAGKRIHEFAQLTEFGSLIPHIGTIATVMADKMRILNQITIEA